MGTQKIGIAVIVSNFGAAANIGGDVERRVRTFDLPEEISEYIRQSKGQWTNISLAIHEEKS